MFVAGLDPQVEGYPAQNQTHQHQGNRYIQGGENQPVGFGKGNQQYSDPEHDPGFVGIPEGANGGNHGVFFLLGGSGQ